MIGTRVNNYEIVSLLGQGGMGAVYLARHPFMGRNAAVKFLRRELCDDQVLVSRFMNEARAANAIRHPNIIDIIDVGLLPDKGTPYLVMEFLEGENLAARIKRTGRLRVGEAIEIAYQAASALTAAHAKGIVHRDLKPENMFIIRDGTIPGRELLKILDFGIAKLLMDVHEGQVRTQTGAVMGTPPYMSPEQCRGIAENIDHRTDIYALGIILYEMLTGAPPFVSPGYGEILMMHMSQTPVPPRQNNPGIPEHIETAILRALAKKREARFGSMLEFQQVLAAGPARTSPGVAVTPPGGFVPAGSGQTLLLPETTTRHPTTFSSTTGEIRKVVGVGKRRTAVVGGAAAALTLGATLLFMMRAGPARKDPEQVPVAGPVRATGEIPSPPPKIEAPVTPPPAATAPAPQKPAPPPAIEIAKSDPVPTKPQPALMAPKPNKAPAKKKVNASVKALPVEVAPSPAPKATPPPVPAKPSVIDQFDKLVGRPTAGKASP